MAIDWDFIGELEGGQRLIGYVPDPDGSQSGVTVGTGIDLGQMSEASLHGLGASAALIAKLAPYLGLKKHAALAALETAPLTITKAEADALNEAVKSSTVAEVRRRYDDAAAQQAGSTPFNELSDREQTVVCSVAFQYGANLSQRTPNFWRACTAQRWDDVATELKSFGDRYPTRRNKEASFLEQGDF